jgi:hypothetical protein
MVHCLPTILVILLPPSSDVYAFIADVEGYATQYFALAKNGSVPCTDCCTSFKSGDRTQDVSFSHAIYTLVGIGM